MNTSAESIQQLREKIKSIRFCMFTTIDERGELSSRPMTQQALDDDGTLWFFTADDHQPAHELQQNPNVNLGFAEPEDQLYVSLSGEATLVKDLQKAEALWNPMVEAWFPKGPQDPHLSLIKVSIHRAEYWDSTSNKMMHLFWAAKAALTGHPPKDPGEHVTMQLR